jgi:cysteine-S-conjugate beta-lyase
VHGYFGDDTAFRASITGWMARRHGWEVDPEWITTTHGLVMAAAFCIQTFSAPGDGVILFTPVYHAFHRIIRANERRIVESPLVEEAGRYRMDLDALAARLTGRERMVFLCSPHNPGGTGLEPRRAPRARGLLRDARPPAVSDESTTTSCCPGAPPRADAARRARHRPPPGDADRHHQDLQHRRRAHRQRDHPRPRACGRGSARRCSPPPARRTAPGC